MTETKYRFYFPIQVRFADTDAQKHVFFSNYLIYFDESMSAYLRTIGFSWHEFQKIKVDFYYVEARCQFKASAYFEEILHAHARMTRVGNTSFTMEFAVHKKKDDQLVATGQITSVLVDTNTGKPVRVPDEMRQAVIDYEGELDSG